MDIRIRQPRIVKPKIRVLPRPEKSLRSLAERAPEAGAFAERMAGRLMARLRPALDWLYAMRRNLATAGVAVLAAWLFVHVMFGANGMVVYRQKKAEYQSLQKEIGHLQKENDRYSQHIKALKTDPEAIEKEAREQLHYARPGEVVYVSPAPVPVVRPTTNAARK
jgi:cell division protein FtsB